MNWLDFLDIQYKKKGNRPLGVHNIPLIDKRNKKDVDAFNKKYGPQGITLIPDKKGKDGQQQWKPLRDVQGADLPEELLQGYRNNLSSDTAETSISTAAAVQNDKITKTKSIGATNARASWLKATKDSPAAKAFGDSKEANDMRWNLQQQHRKWKADRSPQVEQKDAATPGVPQIPSQDYWNNKTGAPAVAFNTKNPLNIAEIPKGIDLKGNAGMFNPANMKDLPTFGESVKAGEAMGGAGWAAGAGALGKLMVQADQKKKKDETGPIANVNTKGKGRSAWQLQDDPFAQLSNYWNA